MSRIPNKNEKVQIDLHGMTLDEAKRHLDHRISQLLERSDKREVRIITGKGLHSEDGGVLSKYVHEFIVQRYGPKIKKIQDSPHEVALDGVPIRGHFDVTFR